MLTGIISISLNSSFDFNLFNDGISSLQGVHQVAQKLIITKFEIKSFKLTFLLLELMNSTCSIFFLSL